MKIASWGSSKKEKAVSVTCSYLYPEHSGHQNPVRSCKSSSHCCLQPYNFSFLQDEAWAGQIPGQQKV